jgi:hypothetical protein
MWWKIKMYWKVFVLILLGIVLYGTEFFWVNLIQPDLTNTYALEQMGGSSEASQNLRIIGATHQMVWLVFTLIFVSVAVLLFYKDIIHFISNLKGKKE